MLTRSGGQRSAAHADSYHAIAMAAHVKNVTVGTATSSTYCITSVVGGKVWFKNGPASDIATATTPPAGC